MPCYEFQCLTCLNKKELIQKFDDPPPICELCNPLTTGSIMVKVLSKTSFILKGSGWAAQGYSSVPKK